eukprot:scaffold168930_cov15-Tisochrysis_lutea.AAC.1
MTGHGLVEQLRNCTCFGAALYRLPLFSSHACHTLHLTAPSWHPLAELIVSHPQYCSGPVMLQGWAKHAVTKLLVLIRQAGGGPAVGTTYPSCSLHGTQTSPLLRPLCSCVVHHELHMQTAVLTNLPAIHTSPRSHGTPSPSFYCCLSLSTASAAEGAHQ